MVVPGAGVAALLRLDPLRAIPRELGAVARRVERAAPRAAPAVAWLRANRQDVAALLSFVTGLLLAATGGGLI